VVTNLRCNQACTFCNRRAATNDLRFISRRAVMSRIARALDSGAEEIWLTGGEPAMRGDLGELVAFAKQRGCRRLGLETNGTLLRAETARHLAEAGLDAVRVHVSGWGSELDRVTRDPGGFERSLRGMEAALLAGLRVEIASALVRSTAAMLVDLPARAREHFGEKGPLGLWIAVPVAAPDPRELLSYEEAASALAQMAACARRVILPVRLHPDTAPPPCIFAPGARPAFLFALTPGGHSRPGHRKGPPCDQCLVGDRCAGLSEAYLSRRSPPKQWPIVEHRARRQLSLAGSVQEQVARERVASTYGTAPDGTQVSESIIRTNFNCNQACRFCSVSGHLPGPGDAAVRAAITSAAERGAKITLSGGEPTLNPRLFEYIRLAKRLSRLPVKLQTNAIRLAEPGYCSSLVDAGLEELFASLHASVETLSDSLTGAPGTFRQTVAGLDAAAATRLFVQINFVICQENLTDVAPFVRFVATRWPRAFVSLSTVAASTDQTVLDRRLIPRHSAVREQLEGALAEATRLGVRVCGLESISGMPLCLIPSGLESPRARAPMPPGFGAGEFLKAEACRGCVLSPRCLGIRRGYAALHGTGELRPR
jgi:MoaA/NifB/PqqE/SkfB family radical SAM enzyme